MISARRPKVAVVVLVWNARKYLDGLLGSLEKMWRDGLEADIMAVDNASSDGTADEIRRRWPWVRLIVNGRNLGFAGGNNVGLRLAVEAGADYAYLLNQDTEVAPDFLVEAVRAAEADGRIGSVQSLLVLHPAKDLVNSSGNAIHFLGFGYCLDYRRPLTDWRPPTGERQIAYASGAGALYRVAALKQVGLLDDHLFLYHEDLDLGWRLRLAGWVNMLAPASVVWHKYEFSRSIAKYFWMERNRYVVLFSRLRLWSLLVLAPWLLLSEIALLVASVRGGFWREKLKVYAYFLTSAAWAHVSEEQSRTKAIRRVSDREIVRLFVPTISYQEVAGPFTKYVANPLMTVLWAFLKLIIV